jgi:parallel beta-helix repeat protein
MKTNQFSARKCVHAILPVFLFIFCFAFTTQAITYYVSPTGNDLTGNGTAANPWKTLYKATSMVTTGGNIIHVNAGTYIETQQCALAVGVSIEGDGTTSIIKSTITAQYTPIIAAVSPEGTNGNQHISNLKIDGNNLSTSWAIAVSGRSNMSIYNCSIVNFYETGVNWSGRADANAAAPTIYATGNSFHDNIVTNCATADAMFGRGCFQFGGQDGMLIYNNTITNNSRAAGANGWPIKGCNESHIKNCKIYNNTLTSAPFPYNYNGENNYWDFSIELFSTYGGIEIYGNTVTGSIDMNYQWKGAAAYSVWIHDNTIGFPTFQAHRQSGIILEFSTESTIIENNTIRNVADGIIFSLRSLNSVTNSTIQKNLMYNVGVPGGAYGQAIGFFTGTNDYTIDDMKIYNNTIVAATGGNSPYWGVTLSNASNINNLKFKNNIISGFNFGGAAVVSNVLGNITNSQFAYNNFYNNSNNDDPFPGWISATTLPASSTVSGTIKVNPLFVSPTDYHLSPSSPAVDAGTFVGLAYNGVAPDRGFAEVGAVVLPIKLINFDVNENKGTNILQWTTTLESNSDYFSIERSSDGRNFTSIGSVKAAGFSSVDINYTFTDATALAGINYYRLVVVDRDNSKDYSKTVAVSNKAANESLNIATAQLSRSNNNMQVTVISAQSQKTSIALFDANGKLFLNETVQLQKGLNSITKNTRALSSGIYYIKLSAADQTVVKNVLSKE